MYKEYEKYLISWIQNQVKQVNAKGVVVAISGGIDSAVVSSLAKLAFPNNSLGIWMGIESSNKSYQNALTQKTNINIEFRDLDLTDTWLKFSKEILIDEEIKNDNFKIASGNTKSRMRMTALYQIARIKNYLVLGTSNRDEIFVGYYTKFGDGSADIYPIASLSKKEVYELARQLNIDNNIINEKPSADLWEGQNDEEDMGVTYEEIDAFISNKQIDSNSFKIIETYHQNSNHKRFNISKPEGIESWKKNNL